MGCLSGWMTWRNRSRALLAQRRLRLSLRFKLGEPRERLAAARAAHLHLRLQTGTARRPLRLTEDRAAQIIAELHAAHARRFAIRHTRDRTRNRRRDTTRAAIGTACMTGHMERGLALHNAVWHITHDIFPELENRQHNIQRSARPALCHRIRATFLHNSPKGRSRKLAGYERPRSRGVCAVRTGPENPPARASSRVASNPSAL